MLVHAEIAGTNNNNGTEGNWDGVKEAVCGTTGSTSHLPVRSVVPSLLRFLSDKSKEDASFWRESIKACHKQMQSVAAQTNPSESHLFSSPAPR